MEKDYKNQIREVMKDIHSVPLLQQLLKTAKQLQKSERGAKNERMRIEEGTACTD